MDCSGTLTPARLPMALAHWPPQWTSLSQAIGPLSVSTPRTQLRSRFELHPGRLRVEQSFETEGTAAELFVGYGGTAVRETVRRAAEAYVEEASLAPLLRWVTTEDEQAELRQSGEFAALLSAAGV